MARAMASAIKVIGFLASNRQYCLREAREEKKLTRQKAQKGNRLIRTARRAMARGFALLLFLTHPSWAGVICHCNYQQEFQHSGCHASQQTNLMTGQRQEDTNSYNSPHCASEEEAVSNVQLDNLSLSAMACCDVAPQADIPGVAVSSSSSTSVKNAPPPIHSGAQTTSAPAPINVHPERHKWPQRHKRPIYLSLSCWLI